MIAWLRARLVSLLDDMPWAVPRERRVLFAIAAGRDVTIAAVGVAAWGYLGWWAVPVAAVAWSILYADGIANRVKRRVLGYAYNPRVMSPGEWEGANVYVGGDPELRALWERHKYAVLYYLDAEGTYRPAVWEGDPGSGRFGEE